MIRSVSSPLCHPERKICVANLQLKDLVFSSRHKIIPYYHRKVIPLHCHIELKSFLICYMGDGLASLGDVSTRLRLLNMTVGGVILSGEIFSKKFWSRRILDLTEDEVFVVCQMSISFHFLKESVGRRTCLFFYKKYLGNHKNLFFYVSKI